MSNMTQLQFKDGDDGDDINETYNTVINSCDNGYIVTTESDEGVHTMVFEYENGESMIQFLRDILGVK